MASEKQTAPFLYRNGKGTVTLIDIPASNSLACQSEEQEVDEFWSLDSGPPLDNPYPSLEPKTERARANVLASNPPGENDALYREMAMQGLQEIKAKYRGEWCLPRTSSRMKSDHGPPIQQETRTPTMAAESPHQQSSRASIFPFPTGREVSGHVFVLAKPVVKTSWTSILNRCVHNVLLEPVNLIVGDGERQFLIPPRSMFTLGQIDDRTTLGWSVCARKAYPVPSTTAPPGQFDLVLLDPPWHNRSTSRGKKYHTWAETDVAGVVLNQIASHVADGGFLACWITNKPAVRACVLSTFEAAGMDLVEEWLWLKITTGGEPVYAIDGLWRKPYELLLVGKRAEVVEDHAMLENPPRKEVQRRLLVGVPDVHSRKPSLKYLFEKVFALPSDYRALEVFARAVTVGWWSWGDEVLKYNDKHLWIHEN